MRRFFPDALRPYAGRITLTAIGFAIAVLFMTLGFWRTILLVILTAIGFFIGMWIDGRIDPRIWIARLRGR